jgi:hypothetical protein
MPNEKDPEKRESWDLLAYVTAVAKLAPTTLAFLVL